MALNSYGLTQSEFVVWPGRYGWQFVSGGRFWRDGKQWYGLSIYRYFPNLKEGHAHSFEVELGPANMAITAESLRPVGDRLSAMIAAKLGVPVQVRK